MADLVTPIISALSALVGAGVGAFTTYRVTVQGSNLARQAEQARWTRERREDAYLALLAARNRFVDAQIAKGDAMQKWKRRHERGDETAGTNFDPTTYNATTIAAYVEVEKHLADVELYGSVQARTAARAWVEALKHYWLLTRPGGYFGALVRKFADEDEGRDHRDPFIELVRRELGITD